MKNNKILNAILSNEIVAMPTDTVYGLIGILKKDNIFKINNLKKRKSDQPLQILVSDIKQIEDMWIGTKFQRAYINENLNSFTSFIVEANESFADKILLDSFEKTIMFRKTNNKDLVEIINKVGPLFASSANITGDIPINNKSELENKLNIIVGEGENGSKTPSSIISLLNDKERIIR